ncbi:hypothetical protein BBK36DRAFT_1121230 [Trichoderma citrinoviride]|uniref:Copper acquisition factor BIM1-like domain-containing protein n=1 Tax=Trichoderma citrinoviride TaxID=58853 RepID=A0A2T4B9M9_9HYPO|nr:hypothetical protein BBK36DRAFT_1121230 [Trichoderma citrinoviride]PTB66034.1 hypothetical protein BBK36DRAFT_1121230 [Trichoderma citrinoviride]
MALKSLLLGLAAVQAVTAHFSVVYPEWRADTLSEENEDKYSQWDYPCGGVPYKAGNITNWPLSGGALQLDLHHPWTYLFVNLGLGANTTNFNISLTPALTNVTGKGTLCIDKLPVDDDAAIKEGTLASIQVVTSGESGSALYNCADIRFTKNATGPSNCSTSDGLVLHTIGDETTDNNSTDSGGSSSQDGATEGGKNSSSSAGEKSAAGLMGSDKPVLATVVGLAIAFSLGLGL